jgi:hypothetical protein
MVKNILIALLVIVFIIGSVGLIAVWVQRGNNTTRSVSTSSRSSANNSTTSSTTNSNNNSNNNSTTSVNQNPNQTTFTTPLFPNFKAGYDNTKWSLQGDFTIPSFQPEGQDINGTNITFISKTFGTRLEMVPIYNGAGGAGIICILKNEDGSSNITRIKDGQSFLVKIDKQLFWVPKNNGIYLPTDPDYTENLLDAIDFDRANGGNTCPTNRIEGLLPNSIFSIKFDKKGLPTTLQSDSRFDFENNIVPITTEIDSPILTPEAIKELTELLNQIQGLE